MTHVDAFRLSVNPISRLSSMARTWPVPQNVLLAALMLLLAGTAQAAGSSMPWKAADLHPRIHRPDRGGDHHHLDGACAGVPSGGFRKLIQIVFGLSIAFAASSFFLSFFSFSGGAVV